MAYQRKDGFWQASYRDEQGRVKTKKFKTKAAAKKFEAEVRYKKAHDQPLPLTRSEGVYLDELAQEWIDWKKAQGRKQRWLKEWAATFDKSFSDPLCKGPAHTITSADIMAVIGAHYSQVSQTTRNRYIGYLKGIFEFGVDQGYLQRNPLAKWKKGKEAKRNSQLTYKDFLKIREQAPSHLRWALDVAWNIPCRPGPSDLFALRYDAHVKKERGGVEVYHTKVGKWAFIQCSPEFMRALYQREQESVSGYLIEYKGRPVNRLDTSLSNAARRIGLTYGVCFMDVRHLWITTALDRGVEPSAVAYMAGTSLEMIQKNYYEPHAAAKARALEVMPKPDAKADRESDRKVVNIKGRR